MTEEEIKRLKMAVRRYPKTVVGLNAAGHPVVTVHPSRSAVAGLKNFMSESLLQGLEGTVSNPQEAEALSLIRTFIKHRAVDFVPICK